MRTLGARDVTTRVAGPRQAGIQPGQSRRRARDLERPASAAAKARIMLTMLHSPGGLSRGNSFQRPGATSRGRAASRRRPNRRRPARSAVHCCFQVKGQPGGQDHRGQVGHLRVMSRFRGVWYLLICRAFVKLGSVARGQICLFWYPFGTRFRTQACGRRRREIP